MWTLSGSDLQAQLPRDESVLKSHWTFSSFTTNTPSHSWFFWVSSSTFPAHKWQLYEYFSKFYLNTFQNTIIQKNLKIIVRFCLYNRKKVLIWALSSEYNKLQTSPSYQTKESLWDVFLTFFYRTKNVSKRLYVCWDVNNN